MKCVICNYESDNKEDFNDSRSFRALCKMRGHWTCVRDFYTIQFLKERYNYSAGDVAKEINDIKRIARLDMEMRIKIQIDEDDGGDFLRDEYEDWVRSGGKEEVEFEMLRDYEEK